MVLSQMSSRPLQFSDERDKYPSGDKASQSPKKKKKNSNQASYTNAILDPSSGVIYI